MIILSYIYEIIRKSLMLEEKTFKQINKEKLEKAAFILKAVAHPIRLAIIQMLEKAEKLSVNEICVALNCEQSLVSHHLINMKLRGILHSKKEGLNMYYSLKEHDVTKLLVCIENCGCNM
jgi:DNA-binding transcriptional ArsR family regulator